MTFNGSWRLRDQTKTKSCLTFFVYRSGYCGKFTSPIPPKSQSHSRTMAPSTNAANSHRIVFTFAMTNLSLTAVSIADSFR